MDALPQVRDKITDFKRRLVSEAPGVLPLLRRLAGQEAEDLAQETLARALRSHESFAADRSMGAWLARIAYRVFLDHQARVARTPVPVGDGATEPSPDPGPIGRSDDRSEIEHLLAVLGEREREVLMRFHGASESVSEIAARMRLPEGTVKSHLHRARRRLARSHPEDRS